MVIKKVFLGCLVVFLLSGCQSIRKTFNFDTSAQISFNATRHVNPDSDGRASPVIVHLFMLSNDTQFKREDFISLYEGAAVRLEGELVDMKLFKELVPGEQRESTIYLPSEVKYLGLMAEFVQYEGAKSLLLLPIRSHNKNKFNIILDENNMSVLSEGVKDSSVKAKKKEPSQQRSQGYSQPHSR